MHTWARTAEKMIMETHVTITSEERREMESTIAAPAVELTSWIDAEAFPILSSLKMRASRCGGARESTGVRQYAVWERLAGRAWRRQGGARALQRGAAHQHAQHLEKIRQLLGAGVVVVGALDRHCNHLDVIGQHRH